MLKTTPHFIKIAINTCCLIVVVIIAADHWMFRSADREISLIAGEVGGHKFSIGGWPFWKQNLIRLDEAQLPDSGE
ncbi:hypothetical protein [Polystyrenella longa]|nr:hypothetical protein [Polystyrenella longa]